jgi:hypothetical protein
LYVGSGDVRFGGYLYCDGATNLFYFDNNLNIPGLNVRNGGTVNLGFSGTTTALNVRGLITGYNGIQLSGGVLTVSDTTDASLANTDAAIRTAGGIYAGKQIRSATNVLAVGVVASGSITQGTGTPTTTPINYFTGTTEIAGLLTCTNGLTVTAGTTTVQDLTVSGTLTFTTFTASGKITANGGIDVATGQTLNVGTSGTTSPLNAYGLITAYNGLTVNAGTTTLGTTTAATINSTGVLAINNSTASSSTTTGCATFAGGIGVAGSVFVGTSTAAEINTSGVLIIRNTTTATSTTTGCARFAGGIGVVGAVRSATVTTTGAIVSGSTLTATSSIISYSNASGFKQGTGIPSTASVNYFTSTTEIAGLLTCTNGLTVTAGATSVQNLTVNGTLTYTGAITSGGAASFTTLASSGATTLATSSGTTTIGSSTTAQFSAAGALTLQNRLTITSGGVSGSTNTGISISGNSSTTRTNWDQQNASAPNIYEVFSGDLTLRSFWGVSVNLNSGAVNPSGNAGQARIANTSSFTVNRRAVGAGSGVYDNVFSVNGLSGLTTVQSLSGSSTATFSTTTANPYSFTVTSTSDNLLNIACVNAGTAGTPGISLQRGTSATERNVIYVDSSNNFAIYSNTAAANSLTINNSNGLVSFPRGLSQTYVYNTTPSTDIYTGCLVLEGGLGVQKDLFARGLGSFAGVVSYAPWRDIASSTGVTLTVYDYDSGISPGVIGPGVLIQRRNQSTGQTDTFDTAANISAKFPGNFYFVYMNNSTNSITVNRGTGTSFYIDGTLGGVSSIVIGSAEVKVFYVSENAAYMYIK